MTLKNKIKKFDPGKWYKINNCWYAKFLTIHGSGNYWRHSEAIDNEGLFRKKEGNLSGSWKEVSIQLLTDLSEIQKYLPEGHVDKISNEWWKTLKKGDVVRFVKDTFKSNKFCIGKEYTIIEILGDIVKFTGETDTCYDIEEFELVKKVNEVEKWSIGTYVVMRVTDLHFSPLCYVGNIIRIDKDGYGFSITENRKVSFNSPHLVYGNRCKWFATLEEAQEFANVPVVNIPYFYLTSSGWLDDSISNKDECRHGLYLNDNLVNKHNISSAFVKAEEFSKLPEIKDFNYQIKNYFVKPIEL